MCSGEVAMNKKFAYQDNLEMAKLIYKSNSLKDK